MKKGKYYKLGDVHHHIVFLLLMKRNRKNGTPRTAVITPTGRIIGDSIVLPTVSAPSRRIDPTRAEPGSTNRLSPPMIIQIGRAHV